MEKTYTVPVINIEEAGLFKVMIWAAIHHCMILYTYISPSIVLEVNWEHNIYGNVKHEGIQMSALCNLHVMSLANQLWWVLTLAVSLSPILILIDLSTMVAAEWCMHRYNQSTGLVWICLPTSSSTIEHTSLVVLCYGLMQVKYESMILLALP